MEKEPRPQRTNVSDISSWNSEPLAKLRSDCLLLMNSARLRLFDEFLVFIAFQILTCFQCCLSVCSTFPTVLLTASRTISNRAAMYLGMRYHWMPSFLFTQLNRYRRKSFLFISTILNAISRLEPSNSLRCYALSDPDIRDVRRKIPTRQAIFAEFVSCKSRVFASFSAPSLNTEYLSFSATRHVGTRGTWFGTHRSVQTIWNQFWFGCSRR